VWRAFHGLIGIAADPHDVEENVSVLDKPDLPQTLSKGLDQRAIIGARRGAKWQHSDADLRLGFPGPDNVRACNGRTAEKTEKFPS